MWLNNSSFSNLIVNTQKDTTAWVPPGRQLEDLVGRPGQELGTDLCLQDPAPSGHAFLAPASTLLISCTVDQEDDTDLPTLQAGNLRLKEAKELCPSIFSRLGF